MKVRIRDDAAASYEARQIRNTQPINQDFYEQLKCVEGKKLEVETKWLFDNQYNTGPIDGVSENGLRVMDADVEYTILDVRPDLLFCDWCHNNSPRGATSCNGCDRSTHLRLFRLRLDGKIGSLTTHSPAPWHLDDDEDGMYIRSCALSPTNDPARVIAMMEQPDGNLVRRYGIEYVESVQRHDAFLMVNAPTLLAALKDPRRSVEEVYKKGNIPTEPFVRAIAEAETSAEAQRLCRQAAEVLATVSRG